MPITFSWNSGKFTKGDKKGQVNWMFNLRDKHLGCLDILFMDDKSQEFQDRLEELSSDDLAILRGCMICKVEAKLYTAEAKKEDAEDKQAEAAAKKEQYEANLADRKIGKVQ
jgi:hypothetical protein